jgi:hypothetical protein
MVAAHHDLECERHRDHGPLLNPEDNRPPHLSLADRGITFATNPHAGLCVRLRHAVPAIEPFELIRHSAFTVTVADVDGLQAAMEPRRR